MSRYRMSESRSPAADPITNVRAQRRVRDCLDRALEVNGPKSKNYHIRRALQYCVIASYLERDE
jgi:hypothetical protein